MDNGSLRILFGLAAALVFSGALALAPLAGISLRRFSIPSLFLLTYFLAHIGLIPVYLGWDDNSLSYGMIDESINLRVLVYANIALIMVVSGFLFSRHAFGLKPDSDAERPMKPGTRLQILAAWGLFAVCVLVLLSYLTRVDSIALARALEGDTAAAAVARSDMGNAFTGKYWRYHLFFRTLIDYCMVFTFSQFMISRRRLALLGFGVTLSVALLSATMAIEKGPTINLLLMLYLSYVLCRGGRYWQTGTVYFAAATFASLSVMYVTFMGAPDVWSALQFLLDRLFLGQLRPAYFYVEMFPDRIDYLWGRSFPNPAGLLPFDQFALTTEVERVIFASSTSADIVGSAPTAFWAEMYANFGWAGIVFSSFLVGTGLSIVSNRLSRFPLTPPICAATVALAIHYMNLTATSLSGYIIDTTLVAIIAVTIVLVRLELPRVPETGKVHGLNPSA